jgi:hypothetical protein
MKPTEQTPPTGEPPKPEIHATAVTLFVDDRVTRAKTKRTCSGDAAGPQNFNLKPSGDEKCPISGSNRKDHIVMADLERLLAERKSNEELKQRNAERFMWHQRLIKDGRSLKPTAVRLAGSSCTRDG